MFRYTLRLATGSIAALGGLALVLAAPAAAQFGGPPAPPNTGVPVLVSLGGTARATLVIDPPQKKVCFMSYGVSGEGRIGGSANVTLPATSGCAEIATEVATAILANPGAYTFTVGTATGTLGK